MTKKQLVISIALVASFAWLTALPYVAADDAQADSSVWIVENGQPRAQIVIAGDPPRRVRHAATDLQHFLTQISGATLPIVTEPTGDYPATIYVGRSAFTDELGVTDEGLRYGAYRVVSGPNHLVLLGHDFDFEPNEPWARSHGDRTRAQEEWEELTGAHWQTPMGSVFRRWQRREERVEGFAHDSGGSFNAVSEFLRSLGVRWYMPGELGTVLPEMESITLPSVDKTVTPDFPLRFWFGAYMVYEPSKVLWEWRLGMNSGYEVLGAGMHVHGMRLVHGHPAMQASHPEYYALIGGERDTTYRGTGHACFSSEGLRQEAVNFVRAVFDHFDEPAVSLWPQDGYRQCQCDLCDGQSASDLVWGFIDHVAREVYPTHPDRLITGGAYAQYSSPPAGIDRLSPNVAVFISNVGRPILDDPDQWDAYWTRVEHWREKLAASRLIRNENNRYSSAGGTTGERPVPFPVLHPRAMARDLSQLKDVSLGDWNEQARANFGQSGKTFWRAPGLDHLTLYVNARFLWDAGQDLDALLDEYYTLFYGPARDQMQAAFEFAERAYPREQRPRPGYIDLTDRLTLVEMLHEARDAAGDSVYGERIEVILDELPSIDDLRADVVIAEQRQDVPVFTRTIDLRGDKWAEARRTLNLNGKPDELFWRSYPHDAGLRDSITGNRPEHPTQFMARWHDDSIYFSIVCHDTADEPINISTTEDEDSAIFDGDHVEILLETDIHSWYRIVVNPAGAVLGMDMAEEEATRDRWHANAEIATHVAEDRWSVEIRIPVVGEAEGAMDPFHNVVGGKPSHHRSRAFPWHFNVGRVRVVRDGERQVSAYVPTGSEDLQDSMNFAEMYLRD